MHAFFLRSIQRQCLPCYSFLLIFLIRYASFTSITSFYNFISSYSGIFFPPQYWICQSCIHCHIHSSISLGSVSGWSSDIFFSFILAFRSAMSTSQINLHPSAPLRLPHFLLTCICNFTCCHYNFKGGQKVLAHRSRLWNSTWILNGQSSRGCLFHHEKCNRKGHIWIKIRSALRRWGMQKQMLVAKYSDVFLSGRVQARHVFSLHQALG